MAHRLLPFLMVCSILLAACTLGSLGQPSCYYVEASNPLPKSVADLQQALQAAGLSVKALSIDGQGENYVCDNGSSTFGVRSASISLVVSVKDANDKTELGDRAADILKTLKGMTYEQLPHWAEGQVDLTLAAGAGQAQVTFAGSYGAGLYDQGLRGAELWDALGKPPCQHSSTSIDLGEVSARLQAAMASAGLKNVTARAKGLGTQCVGPQNGVVENTTLESVNYQVEIQGVSGRAAMGDVAAQVLAVILQFQSAEAPGKPGDVEFLFGTGQSYVISFATAQKAIADGLKGEAMMTLLETAY